MKGLKQLTSNGLKAWKVWNGNVIVSNPNSYAYSIVFNETCDPHPFKELIDFDCILWCHLDWPIEEWYNSLNKKEVIHVFLCIAMHVPSLQCLM